MLVDKAMRISVLLLMLAAPASAQRYVGEVPEIDSYELSALISSEQHRIESCASRTDASAYVATVRAQVSAGAAPSTMYNAHISISVASRPRDPELESCVRRELADALRHASFAVGRAVRARHTFQISERPERPIDERPPAYSESEVRAVLSASSRSLSQCVDVGGETVTLRVSVRPDGRLVLMSADVPSSAHRGALGCLAQRVASLRVSGRPSRTVDLTHQLSVRF